MDQTVGGATVVATRGSARTSWTSQWAVVGAEYASNSGADGVAGIYAARVMDRGVDPRVLCADLRADMLGIADRGSHRRAMQSRSRGVRFGRGTASHLEAMNVEPKKRSANR